MPKARGLESWFCAVALLLSAAVADAQCCDGDLNGDGSVGINELVRAVRSALDGCPARAARQFVDTECETNCPGDIDGDDKVTIAELIRAVNKALGGCPIKTIGPPPSATPTGSGTAGASATPTSINTPTNTSTTTPTPTPQGDRFVDNGDGTISDNATGLMWEKKSGDGGIHDQFKFYRWSAEFGSDTPNGAVFTEFLAGLNNQAFAGHSDWRLPELSELRELRELGADEIGLVIPPPFFIGCVAGCEATVCDCVAGQKFWTNTFGPSLVAGETELPQVETVDFNVSSPTITAPLLTNALATARAVRGPLPAN